MAIKVLNVNGCGAAEEPEGNGQTPGTLSHENNSARIAAALWVVSLVRFVWGRRASRIGEFRRNPFLIGIFAWAEGWHNSHDASPIAAGHGLRGWWNNVSYWAVRALAPLLHLTSKVGLSSRGPLPMR